jgi:ubiquinone/menaquinone biosynthesis C-methylase UbiE
LPDDLAREEPCQRPEHRPGSQVFYDVYVTTTIDVAFFQEELKKTPGPVLELMAGTGRLSLPLAEAGARLTCVDVSGPMLARLRTKLVDRGLEADLVEADICQMTLPERSYGLALLPFQSFGELIALEAQRTALDRVAAHLRPGGRFVCTMHNPAVRRATVDGQLRLLGTFPLPEQKGTLLLWTLQQFLPGTLVVQALQFYERYDPGGGWRTSIGSTCASALWNGASFRPLPRPRASGWPRSTVPMIDHPSTTGQALS